jgi:stage II sporulation protein D
VGRFVVACAAVALLACGGLASGILAASPNRAASTSTSTTTGTAATTATTVTSTSPSVLAISGHGWGHGLGMSQFGAYGYALHGWTFDRILAHYYPGTTLGPAKVRTVRVLVASAKKTTLSSTVAWSVTDARGAKTPLDPGSLALGPGLKTDPLGTLTAPFTFSSTQPLSVDGRAYRGRLTVTSDGKVVSVVDVVGLEAYLKGVVPSEMPSRWPPEALKAQAVAARSYALANLAKGRPFDLYGDTRSQAYGGVAAESPTSSSAVDATRGQVVLYAGKVADTLFFSTSGGRTASALESTGIDVPYLVPVDDPYDVLSPYHDWGPVLFDARTVAKQLKLAGPLVDIRAVNGPSGRVRSLTFVSDGESDVTVTGNQARGALDLRSTWFTPALLQLAPTARTMTYGGAVSLTGLLRGTSGVTLEAKPVGLGWAASGAVAPAADGTFATLVKPQVSTWYRLVFGTARAGLAKISVAARVTAALGASGVTGTVRPVVAGAPVQLQARQPDGSWLTLSSTVTDSTSAWSFGGALDAGTYRVRVAPGRGLVAGLSSQLVVS